MNIEAIQRLQATKKHTNHWLHFWLWVFTLSTWGIVWFILLWSRDRHNAGIDKQISESLNNAALRACGDGNASRR